MLKNIKSSFILKIIFSLVNPNKKFSLIKYNKNLQVKINIKLLNYKILSGRYIIYEPKSKKEGKEYDSYTDELIFEGEYLHGERNGKGKEYDKNGKVKFEGEYLKGKRNGAGKEYENGSFVFEGKYLKGKRNGIGKEFYSRGLVLFNLYDFEKKFLTDFKNYFSYYRPKFYGEYLDGKRWNGLGFDISNKPIYELKDGKGYIKEYDEYNYLIFEGEYLNGERNGKGKEYKNGKLIFEGEYLNGKILNEIEKKEIINVPEPAFDDDDVGLFYNPPHYPHEEKKIFGKRKEYSEIKEGKGNVKEYDGYNNLIFEGEYLNGERNGTGKEYDNYGRVIFEGEYLNGKRNGKGKEFDNEGRVIFEGEYFMGYKKEGKEYVNIILEYEGEYLFGKKYQGKGYNENGKVIYELNDGNGKVKEYKNGKLIFEGEYLNGKRNGEGKEYNDLFGDVLFEGEYLNGKRIIEKNDKNINVKK